MEVLNYGSREIFADAANSASSKLSVNSKHSRRSRKRFPAACWLSQFRYCFVVLVCEHVGFPMPLHHFVDLLDPNKCLMSPAETTWRMNLRQNLMIILGQKEIRHFPSCIACSFILWSDVAFDQWPTRELDRALQQSLPSTC